MIDFYKLFTFLKEKTNRDIPLIIKIISGYELEEHDLVQKENVKINDILSPFNLPNNLIFEKNLKITNSFLKKIGNNITINGSCLLAGKQLWNIGDNFIVKGELFLKCSNILNISNMKIGGDLIIYEPKFKSISDDLQVEGKIIINFHDNLEYFKFFPKHLQHKVEQ